MNTANDQNPMNGAKALEAAATDFFTALFDFGTSVVDSLLPGPEAESEPEPPTNCENPGCPQCRPIMAEVMKQQLKMGHRPQFQGWVKAVKDEPDAEAQKVPDWLLQPIEMSFCEPGCQACLALADIELARVKSGKNTLVWAEVYAQAKKLKHGPSRFELDRIQEAAAQAYKTLQTELEEGLDDLKNDRKVSGAQYFANREAKRVAAGKAQEEAEFQAALVEGFLNQKVEASHDFASFDASCAGKLAQAAETEQKPKGPIQFNPPMTPRDEYELEVAIRRQQPRDRYPDFNAPNLGYAHVDDLGRDDSSVVAFGPADGPWKTLSVGLDVVGYCGSRTEAMDVPGGVLVARVLRELTRSGDAQTEHTMVFVPEVRVTYEAEVDGTYRLVPRAWVNDPPKKDAA